MVNPQKENGYTSIANEIVEALARTKMSSYESQIIWAVFRKTYGWNKKNDMMTYTQLEKMTGISRDNCAHTVSRLERRKMLIVDRSGWHPVIGFQKDYEQWESVVQPNNISKVLCSQTTSVVQPHNKVLCNQTTTKDNKDTSKIHTVEIQEILAFWNGFEVLPAHREEGEIWKRIQAEIKAKLRNKSYSVDKIKMGIRIYAHVLETSDFYAGGDHKSKWDLPTFLKRRNGLAELIADPISYVAQRTKVPLPFCPECGGVLERQYHIDKVGGKRREYETLECGGCGYEQPIS